MDVVSVTLVERGPPERYMHIDILKFSLIRGSLVLFV